MVSTWFRKFKGSEQAQKNKDVLRDSTKVTDPRGMLNMLYRREKKTSGTLIKQIKHYYVKQKIKKAAPWKETTDQKDSRTVV